MTFNKLFLTLVTLALAVFSQAALAITIVNNNSRDIDYTISTDPVGLNVCSSGQLGKGASMSWITSSPSLFCNNPATLYVSVMGLSTFSRAKYCTPKGSGNGKLQNVGTIVSVADAGFGKGIYCYVQ